MQTKTSLLSGVAMGVLLAAGLSGAADAKTKKHHHAAPAPVAAPDARVTALADEVEALKARLDAETLARQQDEAQVQAAQAKAAAAEADAQAARGQLAEQIQTIPGEVKSEVAAATPKPGWWGDTKVGGQVFSDISNIHQTTTSPASALVPTSNGTDVDLKRFYMIIDHNFNDMFSADLTTDVTYDSTTKASQLYVKKAWLQAKVSDELAIRLGASDLPWIPYVENIYGYRYVENVLIDRTKYGTSTDWGVHAFGQALSWSDVKINYAFSAIDGAGYKVEAAGTTNRSEDMDFEGRVSAEADGFNAALGGYEGKLGKAVNGVVTNHPAERFDALVAYVNPQFRIGGEYLWAKDWNNVTTALGKPVDESTGYSVFGSYNVLAKIALFGRYDYLKPLETTDPGEKEGYYNVGVSYTPVKGVDVALVYKHDNVQNDGVGTGLLTTANGAGTSVGSGSIGGVHGGDYDEIGVFTKYAW